MPGRQFNRETAVRVQTHIHVRFSPSHFLRRQAKSQSFSILEANTSLSTELVVLPRRSARAKSPTAVCLEKMGYRCLLARHRPRAMLRNAVHSSAREGGREEEEEEEEEPLRTSRAPLGHVVLLFIPNPWAYRIGGGGRRETE